MSIFKKNITANFLSGIWAGLMGLVFVPTYISFMGIEAFGLIGLFATMISVFSLLDMGLSDTLNRELARLTVAAKSKNEMRDLVRTLEIPYWGIACLIGLTVVAISPFIAFQWVNIESLPPESVQRAILIMGICAAFQWPLSLYSGGLMGLQSQVLLGSINAAVATLRGLGAVLVLWLISPTVDAFFGWQILISAIHTGLMWFFLWRTLSSPNQQIRPRFRWDLFKKNWKFASGMMGIGVSATLLTQADKIVLSKMLSLENFGYYSLASLVALNIYRVVMPVFNATFPRLTNLVAMNPTNDEIARLYHKSSQLVSILSIPVAIVIVFFAREVMLFWTADGETAERTILLIRVLIMGCILSGLTNIPYALQLAHGWTRLRLQANIIAILAYVPLLVLLTSLYDAIGAAVAWLIVNIFYLVTTINVMHTRLLPFEQRRWVIRDVGYPFISSFAIAGTLRLCFDAPGIRWHLGFFLVFITVATSFGTAILNPSCRKWLYSITYLMQNSTESIRSRS